MRLITTKENYLRIRELFSNDKSFATSLLRFLEHGQVRGCGPIAALPETFAYEDV